MYRDHRLFVNAMLNTVRTLQTSGIGVTSRVTERTDGVEITVLIPDMTLSILCETLFSHSGDFYNHLFESATVSPGTSYGFLVGASPRLPDAFSYGYLDLSGECDDPDGVMEAFLTFVRSVRENGLSRADFERAKRVVYAEFVSNFDTTEDVASLLGSYAADGLCAFDFFEVMESITYRDVTELFDKTFRDSQYTLSVILPAETAE